MPPSLAPDRILEHLATVTADRPASPRAFIRASEATILAAMQAGYSGIDIYRAFAAVGQPPPMGLRQFRRYLATLRPLVSASSTRSVTSVPHQPPRHGASTPAARPAAPATFRWNPLADDGDIH